MTVWSRETFGDIFQQLLIREDIARIKEKLFAEDPSVENMIVMQMVPNFARVLLEAKGWI